MGFGFSGLSRYRPRKISIAIINWYPPILVSAHLVGIYVDQLHDPVRIRPARRRNQVRNCLPANVHRLGQHVARVGQHIRPARILPLIVHQPERPSQRARTRLAGWAAPETVPDALDPIRTRQIQAHFPWGPRNPISGQLQDRAALASPCNRLCSPQATPANGATYLFRSHTPLPWPHPLSAPRLSNTEPGMAGEFADGSTGQCHFQSAAPRACCRHQSVAPGCGRLVSFRVTAP